jgi:polar amino acid transport system substrate-binding protein
VGKERFPNAEILYFNEHMGSVAALKSGQIDGSITSWPSAFLVAKYDPDLTYIDEPLSNDYVGIAVKKGENDLLNAVDDYITKIKDDGTLAEMEKRWFDMENRDYVMPDIPIVSIGKPLIIGVSADREPMTFLDSNGNVSGMDGELARRIGLELNRPVKFVDMRFSALITALESNQVDLVISNVSITEERRKAVEFTQPYNKNPQMMIVRDSYGKEKQTTSFAERFHNNLILNGRYTFVLEGVKNTLIISLFSCILGVVIGFFICCLRLSKRWVVSKLAQIYIHFFRGMPVALFLMITYYVVLAQSGLSALTVAIIVFSIHHSTYLAEVFRSGYMSINVEQIEAITSMGFTKSQIFKYVIVPQALKVIFPVYKNEVITLTKLTSIVGFIGVFDLTRSTDIIRSQTFDAFFPLVMAIILYFIIIGSMTFLLNCIGRLINSR